MPYGTGPKCLLSLRNKTLLQRTIEWFANEVDDFVVCVGYDANKIRQWLTLNRFASQYPIQVSDAGEDAGISYRLWLAASDSKIAVDRMLVIYGDSLADIDIPDLKATHKEFGRQATMCIYPVRSDFGIVNIDASTNRIVGFEEKPYLPYWQNIGYMLFEREAWKNLRDSRTGHILDFPRFLQLLAKNDMLTYYQHTGNYLTINTRKDYLFAQQEDWYG